MNPLTVTGLVKRFPDFELRADFTVPRGLVTGLVGANGAGKTTLIKCALGAMVPDAGTVHLADKQEIGVVFDSPPYFPEWRVKETGATIGRFFHGWDQGRFDELCARWNLAPKKRIKELSRGMGMRLQLAVALSHKASFLILDEPTAGLDPLTRDELLDDLAEFMLDEDHTILLSSHITTDLERLADHVAVLDRGQVLLHDEMAAVKEQFRLVKGGGMPPRDTPLLGLREHSVGWDALVTESAVPALGEVVTEEPSLEDIVIRHAKDSRGKERQHV